MKLGNIKLMAAVSAVALGVAMYATGSNAAAVQSGVDIPVQINGTVLNTLDITVTTLQFGTIAAIARDLDRATYTVAPATDAVTDDDGGGTFTNARLIQDTSVATNAASDVTITGFAATPLFIDYAVDTHLTGVSGEILYIAHVTDNLNAPTTGVAGTVGHYDDGVYGTGPATVQGTATTDAVSGVLAFNIGATISTELGGGDYVYPSEVYNGVVDVTVSY